jgi:hypothetical protein
MGGGVGGEVVRVTIRADRGAGRLLNPMSSARREPTDVTARTVGPAQWAAVRQGVAPQSEQGLD